MAIDFVTSLHPIYMVAFAIGDAAKSGVCGRIVM